MKGNDGKRPRAVLFDAAGTLIRLSEPVGITYARFAARLGMNLEPKKLQSDFARVHRAMPPQVFGASDPEKIRQLEREWWRSLVLRVLGTNDDDALHGFDEQFGALFDHFGTDAAWRCTRGATELLAELGVRGVRTAVVSNFDHRLRDLLRQLGLHRHLELVVLPSDAGAAKPDPAIFHFALDRLALEPARVVYVGDDAEDDITGARAAEIEAIQVSPGSDLRDLLEAF
jgi:putative hydrolase of the HAD superfamily